MKRYRIEKRADGKWHVFAIGEAVSVFWDRWDLAKIYVDARIRCDAEDYFERLEDDLFGLPEAG